MNLRAICQLTLLSTALLGWAAPVLASCRLALVLAVDVSSSVSEAEHALQRRGLAAAFSDPDVQRAILGGGGGVALTIFEWSGSQQQKVIQQWAEITAADDLDTVAARVLSEPRSYAEFPTAMGFALGFAAQLLAQGPVCDRQVVDVSGDGITNEGFRPQSAYQQFPFSGVVVNGLVVSGDDDRVVSYYRHEVLRGPGAFLEEAQGYAGFQDAMTRKLYREVNAMVVGLAENP